MEVSDQLNDPAALPSRKERPPSSTHSVRDWVGPQSQSGHGVEKKNSPTPAGNRTPIIRSSSPFDSDTQSTTYSLVKHTCTTHYYIWMRPEKTPAA